MTQDTLAKQVEDEVFRLEFSEYNARGELNLVGMPKNGEWLRVEPDRNPTIVTISGGPRTILVCHGEPLLLALTQLPVGTDWTTLMGTIRQSLITEY